MAVFSALAYLLDFVSGILSLKIWPQGGSISIAMVPIFLMAYRWGIKGGMLTGFLLGLLQFILGFSQIYTLLQGIIDYFVAFSVVGLAGIFATPSEKFLNKNKKEVDDLCVMGIFGKCFQISLSCLFRYRILW